MIIYIHDRPGRRLHIDMKMFKKNILWISIALAVVAGLIWLLYKYAENVLAFLNGSVNVLSEVVSSDTTHAFVRWVGMLLPAIIWVFVFVKYTPGSLTMFQRSVRNVVLWSCGAIMVWILWAVIGKDTLGRSPIRPAAIKTQSNSWTLEEAQRVGWYIAFIASSLGFVILKKKGSHSNLGCLLCSIGAHIILININIWLSQKTILFLFPGGLHHVLSIGVITVILLFWIVRSFLVECMLNKKIVPVDTIGVGSFLGRRLPFLNKVVGGSVNQLLPGFLGFSWETIDSKKTTHPIEKEAGKTDAVIQCGANGTEFAAHITGTIVVVCEDPYKAKTNPLTSDQMRLYALGALTVVLSDPGWTNVSQIRGKVSDISDQAIKTGTIKQRFEDSGYKLLSITITKVENPPKIEEALVAKKAQTLEEERQLIDIMGLGPQAAEFRKIFPSITNDEVILRFLQRQQGTTKSIDLGGNNPGGKKQKKRGSGGSPPVVITHI